MKWYKSDETEKGIIISSRIRLARNFKKYPFSIAIKDEDAVKIINDSINVIQGDKNIYKDRFKYLDLETQSELQKRSLLERHVLSPYLVLSQQKSGVLLRDDESVSLMLNEEDHIRIQAIKAGNNLKGAYEQADELDNLVEENVEYAFDKDFGYLTSCPTNTGTGLRASFMLHLPTLEKIGHIKTLTQTLGNFGMTVRGIYGEGTESLGSIYQISNQRTMGKSEQEIIETLENITSQIIEKETNIFNTILETRKNEIEDSVYRAYGILKNCRMISAKEAMKLLSDIRIGFIYDLLKVDKPNENIYNIMMNIQIGTLQMYAGKDLNEKERDEIRAEYLRGVF